MVRAQRGFSLAELLVTMAFMPLVAALVYSFAQSAFRSTRTQLLLSEAQDTAYLALSVLTRDLRQAGYSPAAPTVTALARAENDAVSLCADFNGDGDVDDSGESISYQEDAARHTLTRTSGAAAAQPMADHLAAGSLRFAYFDFDGQRLEAAGGLSGEQRRRVERVDASFAIAVPGAAAVQVSASVEMRNAHR